MAFAPDIVVIMLGTNDSKHRGDGSLDADRSAIDKPGKAYKADYVPDYEELIAEFRKMNPSVKVYVTLHCRHLAFPDAGASMTGPFMTKSFRWCARSRAKKMPISLI